MSIVKRWPAIEQAAHRSPIVRACVHFADRDGMRDAEALALAVQELERELHAARDQLIAAKLKEPPPDVVVDGVVHRYIGPCAACGRSGPRP